MENAAQWMEEFKLIASKYVGPQDINVVPGSYCTVFCIKQLSLIFLTMFFKLILPQI